MSSTDSGRKPGQTAVDYVTIVLSPVLIMGLVTSLVYFLLEPIRGWDEQLELWAWYAAYDHVALAQLWGTMTALPREIPRFTKDLRQRWDDLGRPALPSVPGRHDALVDARHNLIRWQTMTS